MSYLPTRRIFFLSLLLSALTVGVLVGCDLAADTTPTALPAPPTPTPLPRGGTVSLGIAADVPDLRPWQPRSRGEEQAISVLYNGLLRLDATLRPEPDLAERYEASPDGQVITFTLRPNLTWHDGQPLTADDAAFTLNALRELSPTTALLADFRQFITGAEATTTSTLVLSLNERYAPILSELTVPILPRHLLRGRNLAELNFWDVPVGSGPFVYERRTAGESMTFTRNSRYFRGEPLLDRVALIVAPDADVRAEALANGQLQAAELPWSVGGPLTDTDVLRRGQFAENAYFYVAFNLREGRPFSDVRVRQALAQAVDLRELVDQVTDGQGQPIGNTALPGSWADLTAVPTATQNLDAARALLDDAGWVVAEGSPWRVRGEQVLAAQLFVRGDDARRVAAAEQIAQAAQTVGISLTVQPADFATVITSKYAPPYDFDALVGSWANGVGDPAYPGYRFYDPSDFALFHSSRINQGLADTRPVLNIGAFSDSAYDNQGGAAHQLYDTAQRAQALQNAQARIAEQKPYLLLWADRIPLVLSQRIATTAGPVPLNTPMYLNTIEQWYLRQ